MAIRRKVCRECRVEKSIRHFYRAKRNRDGHMNACKPCHLRICAERIALKGVILNEERRRRWREDPEYRAKTDAAHRRYRRTARGKQVQSEAKRIWSILNPEKQREIKRAWSRAQWQKVLAARAAQHQESNHERRTEGRSD